MAHTQTYKSSQPPRNPGGQQSSHHSPAVKVDFYKDREKRIIRPDLFSTTAEQLAVKLAGAGSSSNKRSQIRKFYDEVLRLNALAKNNPSDWDFVLPYVNMLIAKATYAHGRNNLVNEDFLNFMKDAIKQVQSPEDLNVFANFFEAFMGFYRKERKD